MICEICYSLLEVSSSFSENGVIPEEKPDLVPGSPAMLSAIAQELRFLISGASKWPESNQFESSSHRYPTMQPNNCFSNVVPHPHENHCHGYQGFTDRNYPRLPCHPQQEPFPRVAHPSDSIGHDCMDYYTYLCSSGVRVHTQSKFQATDDEFTKWLPVPHRTWAYDCPYAA